jgi:hypothetical protein
VPGLITDRELRTSQYEALQHEGFWISATHLNYTKGQRWTEHVGNKECIRNCGQKTPGEAITE